MEQGINMNLDFERNSEISKINKENNVDIRQYSPLALAYMGDCIFDLCVRSYLLKQANMPPNKLHQKAKNIVNAKSQSIIYADIITIVKDEEVAILKRGRNAKTHSRAKNTSMTDYKNATGLEALFGYLYLKNDFERINELFDLSLKSLDKVK